MVLLRVLDRTAQGQHSICVRHAVVCLLPFLFVWFFFPLQHLPLIQSIFYFLIIRLNYFGHLMSCNL